MVAPALALTLTPSHYYFHSLSRTLTLTFRNARASVSTSTDAALGGAQTFVDSTNELFSALGLRVRTIDRVSATCRMGTVIIFSLRSCIIVECYLFHGFDGDDVFVLGFCADAGLCCYVFRREHLCFNLFALPGALSFLLSLLFLSVEEVVVLASVYVCMSVYVCLDVGLGVGVGAFVGVGATVLMLLSNHMHFYYVAVGRSQSGVGSSSMSIPHTGKAI